MRRWLRRSFTRIVCIQSTLALPWPCGTIANAPAACSDLRPGCVELGVAGAVLHVEETTRADVMLRGGSFVALGPGRAGGEMEIGYGHTSELDVLDLLWNVSWQMPLADGMVWPGIALAAGLRQEWLGSFKEDRFPLGLHLGARILAGNRAGFRFEYRYDRILGDPVADFAEHRVVVGISFFLRNPSEH